MKNSLVLIILLIVQIVCIAGDVYLIASNHATPLVWASFVFTLLIFVVTLVITALSILKEYNK